MSGQLLEQLLLLSNPNEYTSNPRRCVNPTDNTYARNVLE